MSLRMKQTSRSGPRRSYSSMSTGSYSIPKVSTGAQLTTPITAVTVNRSLLTPVNADVDPEVHAVRSHEKEQIKGLNNRFASFIDKVRFLEQQNKVLETKWKLLQGQTTASSNVEPMLKSYIANLQRQLEFLNNDKFRLDSENSVVHNKVDEYKTKFEQEINNRDDAENEFIFLKKDVDASHMTKVQLNDMMYDLSEEFNFLRAFYDAELRDLQNSVKDTSVVVQMDNSRGLDMDQIVSQVKAQYEDVAARSREEAESWHKTKIDEKSAEANQYGNELRKSKDEIRDLKRTITRLENEIQTGKTRNTNLEYQIVQAEEKGETTVHDAKDHIKDLEQALQKAKQDMTRQVREYQELMNVKMALDIEISTYRTLLEGEEDRLGHDSVINIQTVPTKGEQENLRKHHYYQPSKVRSNYQDDNADL